MLDKHYFLFTKESAFLRYKPIPKKLSAKAVSENLWHLTNPSKSRILLSTIRKTLVYLFPLMWSILPIGSKNTKKEMTSSSFLPLTKVVKCFPNLSELPNTVSRKVLTFRISTVFCLLTPNGVRWILSKRLVVCCVLLLGKNVVISSSPFWWMMRTRIPFWKILLSKIPIYNFL